MTPPLDKSRFELSPGVWLDHRRAVFLERESILAVADLHLGYAWAQRYNGQMLPLQSQDNLAARLSDLCDFYKPRQFAILGDIVHQAVPVAEISHELTALFASLSSLCGLKLLLGNHDKNLRKILHATASAEFLDHLETDHFLLTHGNSISEIPPGKTVLMGHEHPAISLGDGIASAKFPCFVTAPNLLLLPAFSLWAAGSNLRAHEFMSPLARKTRFTRAIAICGEKLLPVNLN